VVVLACNPIVEAAFLARRNLTDRGTSTPILWKFVFSAVELVSFRRRQTGNPSLHLQGREDRKWQWLVVVQVAFQSSDLRASPLNGNTSLQGGRPFLPHYRASSASACVCVSLSLSHFLPYAFPACTLFTREEVVYSLSHFQV
jgi:hypothetical protein